MGFLAMSIGRLIVLGIFGLLALTLIALIIVGTAAVLGPGISAVRDYAPGRNRSDRKRMPVSTRVLGFGIVFLAIGLGVLAGVYGVADVTLWGIVGMVLLFGGIGLILFYFIASKAEKQTTIAQTEDQEPDRQALEDV